MRLLEMPLRLLYCIYAVTIFIVVMLIVVPFVVVGSFFGKIGQKG